MFEPVPSLFSDRELSEGFYSGFMVVKAVMSWEWGTVQVYLAVGQKGSSKAAGWVGLWS